MRNTVGRGAWLILGGLLVAAALTPLPAQADSDETRVYEVGAKVEGKTFAEWSVAWWKWGLSGKKDRNPILDKTGAFAGEGQHGPVWFLAGNTGGTTKRKCVVPAGKPIFFPVLTHLENAPPDRADEKKLRAVPKAQMDCVTELRATLDGKPIAGLERFRVASPVFTFTGPDRAADEVFENVVGKQKAAADGYWIMLRPLPAGKHTLRFQGKVKGTKDVQPFELAVTYELTVEAKK
jgi:hypothetical protein